MISLDQVLLALAAAAVCTGLLWMGATPSTPLVRVVVRPAVLAVANMLLLFLSSDGDVLWPYALVATAAVLGVWECYAGVYQLLGWRGIKRKPAEQVQICAAWLANTLTSLVLLNVATGLAFPGTFQAQGRPAPALDVIYLTMVTFASAGYGDVLPGTAVGKLLMMVTVAAGLLYATILFAALFQALREE